MNLTGFIKRLEKAGELIRIETEVSPFLEITEIADRFSGQKLGGKAILLENTGTDYPVLINSLGSEERIKIAFGDRSPEQLASDMQDMIIMLTGVNAGFAGKLRKIPLLGKASRWIPKRKRGKGASQEIVEMMPNLYKLPILTCWPYDGGPFITLPLVHTVDPLSGNPNLGMYRMQVFDSSSTGMHWHMHKTGARHYQEYLKLKKRMPVAVALGGDPVYTYCATAPLPDGIDEYLLAGFIRRKPVSLVKCLTQDLWIPEDCDFVLEGYVDPQEPLRTEGPFGDHTGFYSLEDKFPVFHITAITHRRKAVYPATIVGIPPQEDAWLAWVTERLFKPMIKMALVPELTDFHLPVEGVAHNLVLARINQSYPGQGRKVLHTLWGAGQLMFSKFIIITADGPDLTSYLELARYISRRVDPSKNMERASGPLDILDHAAKEAAFGGKLGLDATGPELMQESETLNLIDEQVIIAFRSQHPQIVDMNLNWMKEGISAGIISMRKTYPGAVSDIEDEIRLSEYLADVKFWVILDEWADLLDPHQIVWLTGSNADVLSDVRIYPAANGRNAGMMFIDATVKTKELDGFLRPWPNPTLMNAETIRMVDARWPDYNAGKLIPSRSSGYSRFYQPGAVRKT